MSEDGTFSIRLVDESGDPITNRKITVIYVGMLSGTESAYTDSDGWAEFPTVGQDSIGRVYSYELLNDIIVTKREVVSTPIEITKANPAKETGEAYRCQDCQECQYTLQKPHRPHRRVSVRILAAWAQKKPGWREASRLSGSDSLVWIATHFLRSLAFGRAGSCI